MTGVLLAVAIAAVLPGSGPGCIAAITAVPNGPLLSGQTVTFADGTLVNPSTRFVSRTWDFGDGATETSPQSQQMTVTHTYVNRTGHTEKITVHFTERTGFGTCATTLSFDVGAASL